MSANRIVNMAFMAAGILLWLTAAKVYGTVFELVRPEWDLPLIGRQFNLSNLLGLTTGVFGGILLWRHERVFTLANEVAGELRKVTWPTWEETRLSTIVVVVTTILVSVLLWLFDTAWAAITRVIYRF